MNVPVRANPRLQPSEMPHGLALLRDPLLNKGTAFTEQERDALGLRGFLPAHVFSMQTQVERVMANLRELPNDLAKYVALNELHDRNEALFFRVVCDNIDEIQPLIYTPTVGLACQRFGYIFQRPRGLFIAAVSPNYWPTGPIRPNSSSSPMASVSSASATSAPMAWAFRSASYRSIPPAPVFIRNSACRWCLTSAPTTRRC
jgi:hypothetical protein